MTTKAQAAYDYILKGSRVGGGIGAAAGTLLGGLAYGLPTSAYDLDGKKIKLTTGQRIGKGMVGAIGGGMAGKSLGSSLGTLRNASKIRKGFDPISAAAMKSKPDWLKNAKTKAEARRAYHAQARKIHPDTMGGDGSRMANLNAEWEKHEPLFKNAMFSAFQNEIEKIAMVGALLGGAAGYKIGPNTAKGKAMSTLVGAGLGHATEAAGRVAKREFIDGAHEREMRELYGYQPVAGRSF